MSARDYRIIVEPLAPEHGGGFVAHAPDLPGCMSDGATPGEALENAYDAASVWLETATRLGRAAPSPTWALRTA